MAKVVSDFSLLLQNKARLALAKVNIAPLPQKKLKFKKKEQSYRPGKDYKMN